MTYVVRVWEKPVDWPMPSGFDEALEQLDRLDALPEAASAKLRLLAERLDRIFPQARDATTGATWTDGPIAAANPSGPVWNIGIAARDRLDAVQAVLVTEAVAMGLNVLDDQPGELHLGNGAVHSVHGNVRTDCIRGMAAVVTGDLAVARADFRRLTLKGNPYAQTQWAQMFLTGKGERHDLATGCALMCALQGWTCDDQGNVVAPADRTARANGEALRRRVGPQAVIHADRILSRSPTHDALVHRIIEMQVFFKEVDPQVRRAVQALADGGEPQTVAIPLRQGRPRRPSSEAATTPGFSSEPGKAADSSDRIAFKDGPWALAVALVPAAWMLTFPDSRRLLEALMLATAGFGSYGAWRTATLLEWSPLKRLLLVAGTLCPPTAIFVVIAALWAALTQSRP